MRILVCASRYPYSAATSQDNFASRLRLPSSVKNCVHCYYAPIYILFMSSHVEEMWILFGNFSDLCICDEVVYSVFPEFLNTSGV